MAGLSAPAHRSRATTVSIPRSAVWLTRVSLSTTAVEVAAVSALALIALAVRWPELMVVPRFTDEGAEVILGWHIAQGHQLPLVNWQPHIGAFFNYLVAGAFFVLGPRIEAGRLLVVVLGALTVVPTYLLGRSIGGPAVGMLSAVLLAASASHAAVNSHIAYSHSVMPLFSTAGVWLLHRAVLERSGPYLAGSGLAFGLAFQTHPSALAIWPGLAVYFLWKGRPLIGRWLILATLGALLAVANIIFFNATTGLTGVAKTVDRSTHYLAGADDRLEGWGGRLQDILNQIDGWPERLVILLREGAASLGGLVSQAPQPHAYLHPIVALYAVLTLTGLVLLSRRGEWLPFLAMVSGLLLLSLFNGRIEGVVPRGRHYALLLPLGYVAVGTALAGIHDRLAGDARRRLLSTVATTALGLVLLVGPVMLLRDYYDWAHRQDETNLPLFAVLEAIEHGGRRHETVYLDDSFNDVRIMGGRLLDHLAWSLEVRGQKSEVFDAKNDRVLGRTPGASRLLVLDPSNVEQASRRYRLEPLPSALPNPPMLVVRAYRL
jgi:4-amino-4-deoxy-L-arabinose transferase-like glycosyltransferase